MKVLNYSKTRENLAAVIDDVVDNDETVIITKNDKGAVFISLSEYNSWKETEYLMQSPNNAKHFSHLICPTTKLMKLILFGKEANKSLDKKTQNAQGRSLKSKTAILGIVNI